VRVGCGVGGRVVGLLVGMGEPGCGDGGVELWMGVGMHTREDASGCAATPLKAMHLRARVCDSWVAQCLSVCCRLCPALPSRTQPHPRSPVR